jgi:hypothetical protein
MKSLSLKSLRRAAIFALALAVAACGGSGGVTVSQPGVALFSTAGAGVSIIVGQSSTYTVGGGGAGAVKTTYTATSNNASVAKVSMSGSSLTVVGASVGSAVIQVSDSTSNGTSLLINITVVDPTGGSAKTALYTTAQGAVTTQPNAVSTYSVAGGTAPYIASSSNTAVASATINGNTLTISSGTSGAANLGIYDAVGAIVNVSVTVSSGPVSALYTTTPSPLAIAVGQTSANYTVAGGTAPYTVTTDNSSIATGTVTGGNLQISGVTNGAANLSVFDSVGAVSRLLVNVGTNGKVTPLYTTAQGAINVAANTSTAFTVAGGTGPYVATTSDASVSTASVSGSTLTINGVGTGGTGTATISIIDAAQTRITVAVTVGSATSLYTTSPSAVTIVAGASPTYEIRGGVAPYVATSSAAANVTTSIASGNLLTINGLSSGGTTPFNVVVTDSVGKTVTIAVTVQ